MNQVTSDFFSGVKQWELDFPRTGRKGKLPVFYSPVNQAILFPGRNLMD